MASPTETDRIRSCYLFQVWDHDPGTTDATVTTPDGGTTQRWVDMRDYTDFAVIVATTVLGGNGPTKVEIVAADDTSGTNTVVIKDSGTIAADALADWVIETCTAAEVAQESSDNGYTSRYVAARITCNNAGDEALVTYFGIPKRPRLNLTAQTTIS